MNPGNRWPASIPRPRDYLETAGGLHFAVVSSLIDAGHALTSLRYVPRDGALIKVSTGEAEAYLRRHRAAYPAHSTLIDAMVHRVPLADVIATHRPDERLMALRSSGPGDRIEERALRAVDALVAAVHHQVDMLDHTHWEAAWSRRGGELSLDEYMKAEARKRNKAVIEGTRLDLTLVVDHDEEVPERGPFRKLGLIVVEALVTNATAAFDHPARYQVQHGEVSEVVSFTPTYAGQAVEGETIEASGWLEEDSTGARRLVVGTSREAGGEYVVVTSPGSSSGR